MTGPMLFYRHGGIVFTSYFGNLRNIPLDLEPVSIARGTPAWSAKRVKRKYLWLAPADDAWFAETNAIFVRRFRIGLKELDPQKVFNDLGENAVLMCWERPNFRCHRRLVAEWLEEALGIEIPEYGFDKIKRFKNMPMQPPKVRSAKRKEKKTCPQILLF
jgi:hypothetical protein